MPGVSGRTYKESGVDVDAGDALVDRIKPLAARTRIPGVLADVGGFAGLFSVPAGMRSPVLVAGTDGVGTKLKIAFEADRHETIGIDLVAMSANDVAVTGAQPLFFLDYFATSRLDVDRAERVIEGIARGCRMAGCALLGGETAELPGFYAPGEYDLAGFVVGIVERAEILDGRSVVVGDAVVGLGSSGLHSNGFSLARRVLLDDAGLGLADRPEGLPGTLADVMLEPTRIYVSALGVARTHGLKSAAHVTGGGLPGNLPRALPDGLGADLDRSAWPCPPIFGLIQRLGGIDEAEMYRTFNMGVGLVLVVSADRASACVAALRTSGHEAWVVGSVVERPTEPLVRIA